MGTRYRAPTENDIMQKLRAKYANSVITRTEIAQFHRRGRNDKGALGWARRMALVLFEQGLLTEVPSPGDNRAKAYRLA